MKITIAPYDPNWSVLFSDLKKEIGEILKELDPVIEHVGSTSVPKLAAKPIIDIAVGLSKKNDLDRTIEPMMDNHFIYYEIFNEGMPNRRLFVKLKNGHHLRFPKKFSEGDDIPHDELNLVRIAHVHIWEFGTSEWTRHIAFREYLKTHEEVKKQYANLKKELSKINWEHGMAYNDGKNDFIKREEAKAVAWYNSKQGRT
ncbi:MAG: GrpB family protein [Bacteroidota bacterium]